MSTEVVHHDTTTIDAALAAAITALADRESISNVFLAACGGSFALMTPLEWIIQSSAKNVEAHALNAREFTTRQPATLGPGSVVILCSHSGNTPETVEAAADAREKGALTIALTHEPSSPLAQASEYVIPYQHGDDKNHSYTAPPLLYRLVYALVDHTNAESTYAQAADEAVAALHDIVGRAVDAVNDEADRWGKAHARSEIIYTLSSGPNYGVGYAFAICLLQEMLWVHSQGINGAEYFHGPFEITDVDVPFLELVGIGASRPIDERASAFVTSKSEDVTTIDAEKWDLSSVREDLRASYAHLVFSPVLRRFADALADHKGHPLTVRRYMWRMEY